VPFLSRVELGLQKLDIFIQGINIGISVTNINTNSRTSRISL